ncbi:unnamed protein product [Caenorhabditis angaria]|uniref:Uncharacterized protein n=1 Tax=Caenorhabditis angaria TaxID=860376 RepID=A0A9P1I909_9PELO|nr:unnamed protein product [Caenorhabditis angaria]
MRNIIGYTRGMVLCKKMENLFRYSDSSTKSIILESIVFDVNTEEEMLGVVEVFTTSDRFPSMVEACKKQIEKDLKFKGFSQFGNTVYAELLDLIRYRRGDRENSEAFEFIEWYMRCLEKNGIEKLEEGRKLRNDIEKIKTQRESRIVNMRNHIREVETKFSDFKIEMENLKKENARLTNQILSQKYRKFLDKDYDNIIDSLCANLNELCHRYPESPEYSAARNYVMDFNETLEDLVRSVGEELEKIERNPWAEVVELELDEFPNDAFLNDYTNWVRDNGLPDYFHQ